MWVISHHFSINLDQCCFYRANYVKKDETVFKMSDGEFITITCDYKTVCKQVTDAMTVPDLYTVVLEY